MSAESHDEFVALASQLPVLLGTPLPGLLQAAGPDARELAGGQFRAVTRMTESAADMLADLIVTNRDHIRTAYQAFDERMRELLSQSDRDELIALLRDAGAARRGLDDPSS
jgi:prephenate dehydrogenase